ncbi:MAG TPA: PAS domain S-box protein, partial [Verrucomicrobiae bacterium]|nr:PAS domain S-box protein [Verrucomicrobiae bacterium]
MSKATRILLVDDEPDILTAFSFLLRHEGYEVWTATSGAQALQLTREMRPDVVLLDVMLTDISGLKICKQIKADPGLIDVFVILISGMASSPEEKADGLAGGADDYLSKPVNFDEFRARVRTIVRLRDTTAALRASEQHYRRLLEILPEAVGLIEPQGRLLTVNPQAAALLGYADMAELLQKRPVELVSPEDLANVPAPVTEVLETGIVRDVPCTLVRKDGSRFPAEVTGALLKDQSGVSRNFVVVVRDVTQRKRAAEILRASEERFRQLAENINDVFWIADPATNRLIYVSRGYEKIWGRSCESLLDSSPGWIETVHPDDRERVRKAVHEKQAAGTYDEVYRITRLDGSERWIQDRAFPVRDDSGTVYRLVGIAEDITKRKQAEEAVREAETRYRTIFEHATEGIFRATPDGRFLTANPALAKMLAYKSAAELIRDTHIAPELLAELKRRLEAHKLGGEFEVECARKDGLKVWLRVNGRAVKDNRGGVRYYDCTSQDITARKQAEAELRQLPGRIIEAGEAERLRVAHELHDGVNQTIASAKMRLRKVQAAVANQSPAAREILLRCEKLLVQALEENRRIAHNLHPSDLDKLGLAAACRALCHELHARTNLKVTCSVGRLTSRLSLTTELNLFRIVQEAFNNIEKHAEAKNVQVRLGVSGDEITLRIKDDGRGFDLARVKVNK